MIIVIVVDRFSGVKPSNGWWRLMGLDCFQDATFEFQLTTSLYTSFVVARNDCSGIWKTNTTT
jgi:G:T/U-mismatch repair DNA glycosylase